MEFYEGRIKPLLTDDDEGRFIAIDAKTGEYEIGDNEDVGLVLKESAPDSDIFMLVYPRIWVHSFGGRQIDGTGS